MMTWLGKLDPNVAVPVAVALLTFLYHHLLSPAAQAKIAQRVSDALFVADSVMSALVVASPPGTTKGDLEGKLWDAVKLQLAHVGLDVDKLPPAIESAARAQVTKWLAQLPDASSSKPSTPAVPPIAVIPPKESTP